jgi:predicted acylesterase/phospholipase RssA
MSGIGQIGSGTVQWQSTVEGSQAGKSVWQTLKGVFSTPTQGMESVINARENFKAFFQEQVSSLGQGVPEHSRAGFEARGQELVRGILENSLDQAMQDAIARGDGKVSESVLREAISGANAKAKLALMELETHALRARISDGRDHDVRPQVISGQDGRIQVIRQAPQIENLVLRGGGAKGIGNPPALIEMENAGMLSGLKRLVGTSAGALTAVCLSCGQNAKAFSEFSETVDMNELKAKPENFEARYPGVDVGWRKGFHAGRALELLDQTSAGQVSSYLEKNWNTPQFQEKLARLKETEGEGAVMRLAQLRTQDFTTDRTSQMVTFRDLHLMHELEPTQFKELTLTGWDDTNKRETYFNSTNTPDMPLAVAGRISMSIPIFFKSVTYDPGDGQGPRTFTDGGVGSNMPTEAVLDGLEGRDLEETRARTAIMTFDENGKAYTVMHGAPEEQGAPPGAFKSWLAGNPGYAQSSVEDREKIRDAGPNAFLIFHGDIGTFDLGASPERVEFAQLMSTVKTLEQIEHRQGQAYSVEYTEPRDCFAVLNDLERQALRQGGPPLPGEYERGIEDPAYRFQNELYLLALREA